ncbi:MAG: cobalamin-dependent protein [Desulfamplus sp.]|nr:cobalamin-dependent protein [Desulfamplus sp.]
MSRILLISSNTVVDPMPTYPLGMALVAAALEKDGHRVEQIDPVAQKMDLMVLAETAVNKFNPDLIGISVRNIDTVDSCASKDNRHLGYVKKLVEHIRTLTPKPVVLGGPAFSIMPEAILSYTGADFGVVGEGETLVRKLVQDMARGIAVEKIVWPEQKLMDAPDFLPPHYDERFVRSYHDESGMLNYQTKRGCPYNCNYCTYPLIEGKKIRYQEPGFVADNLLEMKLKFGVETLFFTDSVFNDPNEHYLEVALEMIRKKCGMKWAGYFRPEKISSEKLDILKRSGLYAMELGSDAASDTTLKGLNKSFDFQTIIEMNENCNKAGIPCAHFFIFGGPGETRETVEEGLGNIKGLENCAVFVFSGIRILPGTGIHKIAVEQGVVSGTDDLLEPRYYFSPGIDKKSMDDMIISSFKNRRDRFFPPEKGYMRMHALKIFGLKGLLWDMAINFQKPLKK